MQVVTRKGVFETNSSSSHSISIVGNRSATGKFITEADGEIHVIAGRFGWGPEIFHTCEAKASYCYTFILETHGQDDSALRGMLRNVIARVTDKDVVFEYPGDYSNGDYYIDHQSRHVCYSAFASEERLEDFIFNPESRLTIDHDNH